MAEGESRRCESRCPRRWEAGHDGGRKRRSGIGWPTLGVEMLDTLPGAWGRSPRRELTFLRISETKRWLHWLMKVVRRSEIELVCRIVCCPMCSAAETEVASPACVGWKVPLAKGVTFILIAQGQERGGKGGGVVSLQERRYLSKEGTGCRRKWITNH